RGADPHRLGPPVWQGQSALREELPRHRHRSRGVARQTGPDADRRRQLAGGGGAQPRQPALAAGASGGAGSPWDPTAREPEARRAGRQTGERVCVRDAAVESGGLLWIDGGTGGDPLGGTLQPVLRQQLAKKLSLEQAPGIGLGFTLVHLLLSAAAGDPLDALAVGGQAQPV